MKISQHSLVKKIRSDYDIIHVFPSSFNITHNPLLHDKWTDAVKMQ